jgi:hypothetical protein
MIFGVEMPKQVTSVDGIVTISANYCFQLWEDYYPISEAMVDQLLISFSRRNIGIVARPQGVVNFLNFSLPIVFVFVFVFVTIIITFCSRRDTVITVLLFIEIGGLWHIHST